MRVRAVVVLLSLAACASASVVPAAARPAARPASGGTTFSHVVVDGGKDVVFGLTTRRTVTIGWTAEDPDGVAASWAYLWHGPDTDDADGILPLYPPAGRCAAASADRTTVTCEVSFVVDPARDLRHDGLAGTWKVLASAQDGGDDWTETDVAGTTRLQRLAEVTVNASPEPVKKGRTLTVTGGLTRADWERGGYGGYQGQSVRLQFRKKGGSAYTTLKTVRSGSRGVLRTTTVARTDGYFRFLFPGTATTGPATAAGDFVDVR
ncbi:hypothetical protein [Streptomyces sp. NPDC001068]|uniref:hypothetical protein n=1 Tax=Streptomyces sp. NPDC001068 TaxID=3364544 RepID=UPI00367DD2EE